MDMSVLEADITTAMVDVVTGYEAETVQELVVAVRGRPSLEAFELALAQ
jgi:hypothetical protein